MKIKPKILLIFVCLFSVNVYAVEFTISGNITDKTYNFPVQNHEISFFIEDSNETVQIFTDLNGFYSKTFDLPLSTRIVISLSGNCNSEILNYSKIIYSEQGQYKYDMQICHDIDPLNCKAYFSYLSEDKKVIFTNRSEGYQIKSYWDFGDGTFSLEDSPVKEFIKDSTYSVSLKIVNAMGSEDIFSEKITINGKLKISGKIFAGYQTVEKGLIFLIKKQTSKDGNELSLSSASNVSKGSYSFRNIEKGEYLILAVPIFNYDFLYFPKYFPTYSSGSIFWNTAEAVSIDKSLKNLNINLTGYTKPYFGDCAVSGRLIVKDSLLQKSFIPVFLQNKEKETIAFCLTDSSGEFIFKNIPKGKYFLKFEKILYRSEVYSVELNNGNSVVENIEFIAENKHFYVKNQKPVLPPTENLMTFPNPVRDVLKIDLSEMNNDDNEQLQIDITNIAGKKILGIKLMSAELISIDFTKYSAGMYFVKILNSQNNLIGFKRIIKDAN